MNCGRGYVVYLLQNGINVVAMLPLAGAASSISSNSTETGSTLAVAKKLIFLKVRANCEVHYL